MSKAQAHLEAGKTMAQAVAAMSEDEGLSYLFARPAPLTVEQTSTSAGAGAPRGASTPAPVQAPKQFNAWSMSQEEWNAWQGRRGWMELVVEAPRGGRPLN